MPKAMTTYKRKSRSKYYDKYRQLKATPTIYPSPYDSLLVYYNELQTWTDTNATAPFFCGAYRIQRALAHVNLRGYFGQYRVEKLTVKLQFSEGATQNSVFMATTHSADGATIAAPYPTSATIRNYRDCEMFQIGQNCPKKVWYFSHSDPNEYTYRDVLAATATVDDEFSQGGVQFYVNQSPGTGTLSISALLTFKVRYHGKQAVAL